MSITHPWLATAWDAESNGPLGDDVTSGAADVVSWRCEQGHHWTAAVKSRAAGAYPCPRCPVTSKRQPGTPSAAKLGPDQIRAIRADPRPTREVAHAYQVTSSTVTRIKSGRAWPNLT
ncbi:zinc-ribbon domain-containing protein [Longispora fulva]|uniref:Treble clef zinc finger domain-containing protein n=1 Tax=Longispora fulva TaxID=619741 RepID=A0A8J7KLX2_9ACTN|nr:zinc-ribbon domain-containing protein [Longispora fulva]MBG6138471.1 hypothetical protein [Longispora fulva]